MDAVARFAVPGLLFALVLAAGVWLSHAGKPYNGLVFNIHKLMALAAVVLAALQARYELALGSPLAAFLLVLVLAGLSIVALFVTGALMSIGRGEQKRFLNVHKTAIVVAIMLWPLGLLVLAGNVT